MSGSPRRASPYLAEPPCQEQAGGRRQREPARERPLTLLWLLQSATSTSPPPLPALRNRGTPPIAQCCTPKCPAGHSSTSIRFSAPPPASPGVRASSEGSEHPRGGCSQCGDWARRASRGAAGELGYLSAELGAAINLERAAAAPAKNHIRCVWQRLDMRETRGLDLEEGGSIPSPRLARHPPPGTPRRGPASPGAGSRDVGMGGMRGWEHEAELGPLSRCAGRNSSVLGFSAGGSAAGHSTEWHSTARHGCTTARCIPTDAGPPCPQPSAGGGGGGRWLQAVPEPAPSQEVPRPPRQTPGPAPQLGTEGKRPSSPPPRARPGERVGAVSPFAQAGRRSQVGTVGAGHPPCQCPPCP